MVEQPASPTSVVILAGGHSSRLGRDKSMLPVNRQPLVARTVHALSALSEDLVIVTNDPGRFEALSLPARLVPDEQRGIGALMGVYSGLRAIRHPRALVVACDMPFLSLPLLRYMLTLTSGHDVVIPRLNEFLEPLHAIYSKGCLPPIKRLLDQGRRQIMAFFPEVRVRYVEEEEVNCFDPQHLSFLNVNTAEDWQRVQGLLATWDTPPPTGATKVPAGPANNAPER
jgi:molybdopterin-guanine dinucleotide biosynthesis protein A